MIKRPLVMVSVAYAVGIIMQNVNSTFIFILLLILLACGMFTIYGKKDILLKLLLLFVLCFGYFYSNYKQDINISSIAKYSEQSVRLEGTFIEIIKQEDDYCSFKIKVNNINNKTIKNEVAKVNYYTKNMIDYNYGDLIEIDGLISIPDGARNLGGFNYQKYLLTQNIYTIITAKNVSILKLYGGEYSYIKKISLILKQRIINVIRVSLPSSHSGLLEGILLSEKNFLDDIIKLDFQNSGISHLLSVSGLHVGYVVLFVLFIFKKISIKGTLSVILLTFILIVFILITGSSPSVIRASIMSLMIVYGRELRRSSDVLTSIGLAALVLLLYNPMLVYSVGFQLSFGATLSIVLLYSKVKKIVSFIPKYIGDLLAVTLSVQIGILPVSIYYFNNLSLISIVINILAVPLAGVIVIAGLCLIILGQIHIVFAKTIGFVLYYLLSILMYIGKMGSIVPFSTVTLSTPSAIGIVLYYIFIFIMIYKYKNIKDKLNIRIVSKIAIGLIIMIIVASIYKRPLEITCIDVGQGDAIFIKTPSNKVALIDAGGFSNTKTDAGEGVIIPFLLDKRIGKIDIIFISHTDKDHVCGLDDIVSKYEVETVVLSARVDNQEISNLLKNNDVKTIYIKNNGRVVLDKNTIFELFAHTTEYSDKNDDESLIVGLNYKKRNFLFTGDSSVNLEKEMLSKFNKSYDVLKVGHHGSKTSTSDELLSRIKPNIALISVGKNNKFNHPSSSVIDRLLSRNISVFRTDQNGGISVFSNGDYIKVKTMNGDNKYGL